MFRLSLSRRFIAIGGAGFLALWITLISSYYFANGLSRTASNPPPGQIAAIVALLKSGPAERWPVLIDAVNSPILDLSVAGTDLSPENTLDLWDDPDYRIYREVLGDDLLSIRLLVPERRFRRPRLFQGVLNPVQFRVRLSPDRVLVMETRTPFIVSWFGLPVGLGAGLVGTLFGVVALIVLHREIRPLTRLAAAVDRIDPVGAPVVLPKLKGAAPETRALLKAFDRLQTRLHALVRARLALIGGIQHDVRTFATRLRLRVEHIPDEREREKAAADIDDMIELLDDALLAGRAGVGALNEELLDLVPLLEAEVRDRRAAGGRVTLAALPPETALVIGDRLALRRVFANLIDNALKYGDAAHLKLAIDVEWLQVTVDDEGTGIPADQRELLMEPFVRLETSRARKTGGAGLGLAVARNLVEAHGGSLEIDDAPAGGARLIVRLCLFRSR
ncbi:HAMP domain-containing histidine kinase [Neorhizobium galegae]|nr:HAMP domain-containing histidine kinase [Neorhizobium galegae]KAB1115263.1 HAMP domain-containing histidine kinase [Neorhizobium galegae]CDZ28615.1 Histidine kinase [Neorhizobium galegae bv. officinalis]CDZ38300.1 Histidine kinase [Neorhizobium galegae bv. officinalis]